MLPGDTMQTKLAYSRGSSHLAVCNKEENQTICKEIHIISRKIMDQISNILGNGDGQMCK
jgi:hypothetical protein